MTEGAPLSTALRGGATVYVTLWAFMEPLTWLGVLPAPAPWIRYVFFASVVAAAAFLYVRRVSVAVPLTLNLDPDPLPEGGLLPLRVVVKTGFIAHPSFGTHPMLTVCAQNHSSQSIFLSQISLSFRRDQVLPVMRDDATGEFVKPCELRPGQSREVHINPFVLVSDGRALESFDHAVVRDAIDRRFTSPRGSVRHALESLLYRSRE